MNKNFHSISIDVWGDFAMFTRPNAKVERDTYLCPTPSACRGILNAIYSKPVEFYYEITGIEIMKPIHVISMKRNEVNVVVNPRNVSNPGYAIYADDCRTQRMSTYLTDVYYRIHANIVLQDTAEDRVSIVSVWNQFCRRVEKGKCFFQPYLGTRECICHFSLPDAAMQPIKEDALFGITLYDVFDIKGQVPLNTSGKRGVPTCEPLISFFDAKMHQGRIDVPEWDSDELFVRRIV